MNFEECKTAIINEICDYSKILINVDCELANIDNPEKVIGKYRDMDKAVSHAGAYGAAILRAWLNEEQRLLFINPPKGLKYHDVNANIKDLFDHLGFPSTQTEVYRLSGHIKRKGLVATFSWEEKMLLAKWDIYRKVSDAAIEWCRKCNEALQIMDQRFHLIADVTREEIIFADKLIFDWHYNYVDDINVYNNGLARHEQVIQYVELQLEKNPHLEVVVQTMATGNGLSVDFFRAKERQ